VEHDQGVISMLISERARCIRLAEALRAEQGREEDLEVYKRRIATLSYLLRCVGVD